MLPLSFHPLNRASRLTRLPSFSISQIHTFSPLAIPFKNVSPTCTFFPAPPSPLLTRLIFAFLFSIMQHCFIFPLLKSMFSLTFVRLSLSLSLSLSLPLSLSLSLPFRTATNYLSSFNLFPRRTLSLFSVSVRPASFIDTITHGYVGTFR